MRVSESFMQSYMHMRCQAQQLDSYSSARHCSTARQLDSDLTDLNRPRQHSTPSLMESGRVRLDRLDRSSTVTRQARQARPRQRLDSASTVPRRSLGQLDSQGSKPGKTPFISILFCTRLELSALQHTTRKSHDFEVRTGKAKGVTVSLIPRRGIYVSRIDSPGCMWLAADLCSGLSC